jgi:hypothetical protein
MLLSKAGPPSPQDPGPGSGAGGSWAGIVSKAYFASVGMLNRPLAARVTDVWEGLPE